MGTGWVCEAHPAMPAKGDYACPCGGPAVQFGSCRQPQSGVHFTGRLPVYRETDVETADLETTDRMACECGKPVRVETSGVRRAIGNPELRPVLRGAQAATALRLM